MKVYYAFVGILLISIIGMGFFIKIKFDDINKLKDAGYNERQISAIINLDEKSYSFLEKNHLDNVEKYVYHKDYKKSNLERYYKFNEKNDIEYDKVIYIVNNDYDKVENFKYNEILFDLINNKEYIKDNLNRYITYYEKNKIDFKNVIYMVNNDLDDLVYSDIIPTLISEKYYISSYLKDYIQYYNETKLSAKEVITNVNVNRNKDYYTDIKDTDVSKGNLILVNKYNKLSSDFNPSMVVIPSNYGYGTLQKEAYDAFIKLENDLNKEGMNITISSSYRSYWTQYSLYNSYVSRDGKEAADRYSARPGHSEHQTGLVMDVQSNNAGILEFYKYKECEWMKNNSYKYGFILRFPDNKENITGYKYEPWHFRYVGIDVAKVIYEEDITLEEYYAYYVLNKK